MGKSYQVIRRWVNVDSQYRQVVVSGLLSKAAAEAEAKARFAAQPLPWAAFLVEEVKEGSK
jgi:nitroimidazol reductase NimA-like FMN-containing flavoprotein (pyridoxamine 5'-phosphate oxidase superfamily)